MELTSVTHIDGTISMVEMNNDVLIHGADADGNYLGLVTPAPGIEHVDAPPPSSGTWRWGVGRWTRIYSIEELKATKWESIKAARVQAETGGFAWDGNTFDSDPVSQSKIQGGAQMATLAQLGSSPFLIDWTLADNSVISLNANQMIAVGMAMGMHITATHSIGRTLREQIEAATTVEELDAINWP